MLVVSLRGVRDGKSPYLPIQVSLRALLKEIYKKWRDVCFSMVYFRCQFKQDGLLVLAWATPILVSLRGLILIFRQASASLSNGSPLEFLRQVTGGFLWGRWRAVKPSFLFPVFSRGFSANEIFFTMRSPRSKKITKCASYSAWSESCVLIGYPSEQDWPILPSLIPWENVIFIDQACSVKKAGYCPRSLLRFYWLTLGLRLRKRKNELGQYAAILTSRLIFCCFRSYFI